MDPQFGTAAPPSTSNGVQPSTPTVASSSTASTPQQPAQVHLEFADEHIELATRLLAGYTSCEFADFQLQFSHADGQQSHFSLHALVVSRAPLLLQLLRGLMSSQPRPPMPILPLSSPDSAVSHTGLSLVLAALYSPEVFEHVNAHNAPEFLATAVYFGLPRFADFAYRFCEESVRNARTPEEIAGWVAYVEREGVAPQPSGSGSGGGDSRAPTPLNGMNGSGGLPGSPATSSSSPARSGRSAAGPSPTSYEGRLLAVLLDRILRLPSETGAFVSPTAGPAQAQLVEVLKPLPFDLFKRVIEDTKFEVPSDMDRFNFAKKVVAARKQHHFLTTSSPPGTPRPATAAPNANGGPGDFEEAVVMQFGSGAGGPGSSAVNVLRKPRKPTLWKVSNAV
ncbi:hypothetical protein JCM10908_004269 [Rhodotorula pacifica]|uniref:uncharacterized protein n=1 Tax=Rhodotorula pacifica TaxID=1495444 RepID=UPI00316F6C4E